LLNGLEYESYAICKVLKKKYILKVVGDKAWEYARNNSLTTLNIDEFQKENIRNDKVLQKRQEMQSYIQGASLVYVPSEYLKEIVVNWGKEAEAVVVVHNSVPFQVVNKIEKTSSGLFRILFVGRITNWKGVELLLIAVNGMENVEVIICGDGPALSVYQELNRRLGNENVIFKGRVKSSEINEMLAQADILVLASLYEGLSHTLLESLSFGKPCIASNIGGNPEVISHGYNGLLFNPYDHNELKRLILMLVNDSNYYNKLADGAAESSLKFNIVNNFKKVEKLILES